MAALSASWASVPECHSLCELIEAAVGKIEYHVLAVIIYLIAIAVVAMAVVKQDYFDKKLQHKLFRHGINSDGVKDVWRFTIAIIIFNATLHAAQLTDAPILTATPLKSISWLTGFLIIYLVGNIVLWLLAARRYKRDAAKVSDFPKKKAMLIAYFTPVVALFAIDDTFSKNWDFFKINDVLDRSLNNFQTWHGWVVIITLFVLIAIAAVIILLEVFFQDKFHQWGWKFLVSTLVPLAMPIAAVTVLLAVSIGGVVYFYSGVANSNIVELAPVQNATSTQSVAAAQGAAPAQSSAPAQSGTQATGYHEHTVADQTQAIQVDPKNKVDYNTRGLANNATGDYDGAVADFSEAIRLDPKYALAYNNRCLARNNKGESDLALADCNEAIRLDPKFTSAYINRGIVSLYAGLLPMAFADFNQWSQLDPKNAYAVLWLDIVGKRGNLRSRLADATKQIDKNKWPGPIIRLYLGQSTAEAVLIAADDPNAHTKKGQVCEANFFIGELMLQGSKKDEAAQLFRLAAADCPTDFVQYSAANAELKALGISKISAAR